MLNYTSKGSLVEYLKKNGFVSGFSTGVLDQSKDFANFLISIDLTDTGFDNLTVVLKEIFGYLKKIRDSPVDAKMYDELKRISLNKFNFLDKSNDLGSFMSSSASNMIDYDTEDVLRGEYIHSIYDESVISQFLAQFTIDNSFILIGSTSKPAAAINKEYFAEGVATKELYFGIDTITAKLSKEQINLLSTYTNSSLILRPPNNFITTESKLIEGSDHLTDAQKDVLDADLTPTLVMEEKNFQVWTKHDISFKVPKAVIEALIFSPTMIKTPRNALYFSMLHNYLNYKLEDSLADAKYAGNEVQIGKDELYLCK